MGRSTGLIFSDQLDPDQISALLGCQPSEAASEPRPRWFLTVDSRECDPGVDLEDAVKMLLARLPSDRDFWASMTSTYSVDVFCGVFLVAANRGFTISAEVSKLLAERNLEIGFDIYFDPQVSKPQMHTNERE